MYTHTYSIVHHIVPCIGVSTLTQIEIDLKMCLYAYNVKIFRNIGVVGRNHSTILSIRAKSNWVCLNIGATKFDGYQCLFPLKWQNSCVQIV